MERITRTQERLGQYSSQHRANAHRHHLERETGRSHTTTLTMTWRDLQEVACWTVCQVGTKRMEASA